MDHRIKLEMLEKNNLEENIYIESSENQTKQWRYDNISVNQKNNSNEKYQRVLIEKITQKQCLKTKDRINHRTLELCKKTNPMFKNRKAIPDGYDWSEDFDGQQTFNEKKLYFNLKFVVGTGGQQTRTLRDETYRFIETQLKYLRKNKNENIIFINILDGNESYSRMDNFKYLLNLEEYKEYNSRCFVGDMKQFQHWFHNFVNK